MTFKAMDPKDVPSIERKGSAKQVLTDEEVKQAIDILKTGKVLAIEEEYRSEGAARRKGLKVRAAILDTKPKFEVASRVWKDGDTYLAGLQKKEPKAEQASGAQDTTDS